MVSRSRADIGADDVGAGKMGKVAGGVEEGNISRPFSLSSYRVIPNNMSPSMYRLENRM